MKVLGVIPARFGSTRFPGKPLVSLLGKPLVQWVIEAAQKSKSLFQIVVATDDERIAAVAKLAGAEVVMTGSDLVSGTDRVFKASLGHQADVIVNIQGDEPLIDPSHIDLLVSAFANHPRPEMATLAHPISLEELESKNAVKVVVDQFGYAIYFSRFAIPYSRMSSTSASADLTAVLKHIGLYAYTPEYLKTFCQTAPSSLELGESLEQLRALYLGTKIKVLKVNQSFPGVDTPEDLEKVSQIIQVRRSKGSL